MVSRQKEKTYNYKASLQKVCNNNTKLSTIMLQQAKTSRTTGLIITVLHYRICIVFLNVFTTTQLTCRSMSFRK